MSTSITRTDLRTEVEGPEPPVLVEALGAAYFSDAHLPGAINIPPGQVDRLAPVLVPDLNARIVVYCSGRCDSSRIVAFSLLRPDGYSSQLVSGDGSGEADLARQPRLPLNHAHVRALPRSLRSPERTVADMADHTVVEEIAALRTRGYTADFSVTADGQLRCDTCGQTRRPSDAVIESTARFEGSSNPDDQAVVFGLHCSGCGVRGVLVAAYGPTATAEEAAVITALSSIRRPP